MEVTRRTELRKVAQGNPIMGNPRKREFKRQDGGSIPEHTISGRSGRYESRITANGFEPDLART